MDPRKNFFSVCSQSGESRFLNSFSQSQSGSHEGPTPKKPKLEISKNGNLSKRIDHIRPNNSASNNKDNGDVCGILWGEEEFDVSEIAQVEHDETIAQSQMIQLTQGNISTAVQINPKTALNEVKTYQQSFVKKTTTSNVKNSPKVPLRRVSSSQWPSSSHLYSSHVNNAVNHTNDVMKNGKVPNSAILLHSDLEELKLENKRMKEELNKKTGETKILREKVNSTEKEKEKIKNEYFNKMNTLKAEAERNNSNLLKEIKSLQVQLDVKNMEIKTAEVRVQTSTSVNKIQPDSPNTRLRASFRSLPKEHILECESNRNLMKAKTQRLPLQFIRESVMPELLSPSQPEAPISESIRSSNPRLFSGLFGSSKPDQGAGGASTSKSDFTSRCPAAKRELKGPNTSITSCAPLLLSPDMVEITSDKVHQNISQVVDICHQILTELLNQLQSAMCSNNQFIERERELLLLGFRQLPLDGEFDLIGHRELYSDERGIPARRALGLMSLLVEASNSTAKKILFSNSKESIEILDTVRNIVRQIEQQRRTLMFQGVLYGSVDLIRNLLKADVTISKEIQTLMVDILRWIVSARPGILIIRNLLQTLLAAARYSHIINSLCHNSGEKTYKENSRHSMIHFTTDSCILQVLCNLVRNAVTPKKQVLTDLFTLWMLSLFYGSQPRPQWLTNVPSAKSCHCHSLVCKLSFSLLSEACFTYPLATGDDKKQLESVLVRGVLLMNTFMNEDEHLLVIVDPHSLGCYEHFLHSMENLIANERICLSNSTRDILHILCTQEELLKEPGHSKSDKQNPELAVSLTSFEKGEHGVKSSNLLETLESM